MPVAYSLHKARPTFGPMRSPIGIVASCIFALTTHLEICRRSALDRDLGHSIGDEVFSRRRPQISAPASGNLLLVPTLVTQAYKRLNLGARDATPPDSHRPVAETVCKDALDRRIRRSAPLRSTQCRWSE
jgi:hypothetical protein